MSVLNHCEKREREFNLAMCLYHVPVHVHNFWLWICGRRK